MAQTKPVDSVKIPRAWFRAASVDLQRGDDCKEELRLLRPKSEVQQNLIFSLQNELGVARFRAGELDARLTADSILQAGMELSCALQIQALQKDLNAAVHRQKWYKVREILIAVGAFASGILTYKTLF